MDIEFSLETIKYKHRIENRIIDYYYHNSGPHIINIDIYYAFSVDVRYAVHNPLLFLSRIVKEVVRQ